MSQNMYQQPLPCILHDIPSIIGLDASPASSGMSVTESSSKTKHGIPAAPTFFASLKTGLLSRILRNSFKYFTCEPMSIISYLSSPCICSST